MSQLPVGFGNLELSPDPKEKKPISSIVGQGRFVRLPCEAGQAPSGCLRPEPRRPREPCRDGGTARLKSLARLPRCARLTNLTGRVPGECSMASAPCAAGPTDPMMPNHSPGVRARSQTRELAMNEQDGDLLYLLVRAADRFRSADRAGVDDDLRMPGDDRRRLDDRRPDDRDRAAALTGVAGHA